MTALNIKTTVVICVGYPSTGKTTSTQRLYFDLANDHQVALLTTLSIRDSLGLMESLHSETDRQKVYNQIIISGVTTDLGRTDDAWITSKVKSAMLDQDGLRSSQIKVITSNGVVYLMGWVTHSQADLATNVARRVEGVQKVVKVFQYQD